MNIREYISSGIVESYVLGLADLAERAEFERMCAAHEEVRAAREAFEIKLEEQAFVNAIEPPQYVKSRIFSELKISSQPPFVKTAPAIPSSETNDLTMKTESKAVNWMRYLVAACIILLLGSTALNFYLFNQYKEYSSKYAEMQKKNSELVYNSNVLETRLRSYESDIAIMKDPQMSVVPMPGSNVKTSPAAGSLATVYWDKRTNQVYLLVNNLPEPTTGKQYQLWALVDGKPVDAGVFDVKTSTALVKMKNISNAQGFAVTLEKKGGSETPTMDQMYVLGNVKT